MSVIRYRTQNPFKLFDDLYNETYRIPVDLMEDDSNYIIICNLPGIAKENVDIEINQAERFLTLKAETKSEINEEKEEENGMKYIHRERGFSKVARTITFRQPIDASKATTVFENGVLTVTLPKSEEAKPYKLTIN